MPEGGPSAGPDADGLRALPARDAAGQFRRQQPVVRRGDRQGLRMPTRCVWYVRYRKAIDSEVPQEQTIAVRWILRVLTAIPLTPWWVRARRRRNRREMREHLRRYYVE